MAKALISIVVPDGRRDQTAQHVFELCELLGNYVDFGNSWNVRPLNIVIDPL